MAKTVFPLDDKDYYAKDMRVWHIGRTAGIINYTGNDLAVSSAGGMKVSLGPGAAYLFTGTDEPGGVVYHNPDPETFTGETASSTDRYDYVCIEYSESINDGVAKYYKGTGSQPTPLRNATTYQIIVAVIRVRANAGSITNADITDTRFNETYCGLAVDSLARIPTDQYDKQFNAFMDSIRGVLGEDTAGNLLNLINQNKTSITSLQESLSTLQSNFNSEAKIFSGTGTSAPSGMKDGDIYIQYE